MLQIDISSHKAFNGRPSFCARPEAQVQEETLYYTITFSDCFRVLFICQDRIALQNVSNSLQIDQISKKTLQRWA